MSKSDACTEAETETSGEDTSMTSNAHYHTGVTKYMPDEDWEDCSLCDDDDCSFNNERVVLPGREALTSDIDVFLRHVMLVKDEPRGKGETPFNERFWLFVKSCLERAKPIGFGELPTRYDTIPKGPTDNNAFIGKFISIAPLNPIYPNVVSELSGIPLNNVLTELLYATTTGMMSMRFTPMCERCASPTCGISQFMMENNSKSLVGSSAFCRACRFSSPIDAMEKIKVIFLLNTEILYTLAENLACKPSQKALAISEVYAMVPATFSGSGFRYSFGCDGNMMLRPAFTAGMYRLMCTISLTDAFFVVERDATEDDEPCTLKLHVSDLQYRGGPRKVVSIPHGRCRIEVFCDTKSFFIFWVQQNIDDQSMFFVPPEERPVSTSALLVMSHLTYQALYQGSQVEGENFSGALAQMTQDSGTSTGEAISVDHPNNTEATLKWT